jgi:diguanylate cyclase (GGDEF)-like protein
MFSSKRISYGLSNSVRLLQNITSRAPPLAKVKMERDRIRIDDFSKSCKSFGRPFFDFLITPGRDNRPEGFLEQLYGQNRAFTLRVLRGTVQRLIAVGGAREFPSGFAQCLMGSVFTFIAFSPSLLYNSFTKAISIAERPSSGSLKASGDRMSGERYFAMLFEYARIALMEQDFSAIHSRLDALRAQGVRNLAAHLVLTGLYNCAYYQEELRRLGGGRRYPITILMADVNGLKKVNDTLGHEAGDKIIRRAAEVLRAGFRQEDVVARIGGDEFAIIMPETDAEIAGETLPRLETLLRMNNKFYGEPRLSISVGMATAAPGENLETVMSRADDEMYRRKKEYYRRGASLSTP